MQMVCRDTNNKLEWWQVAIIIKKVMKYSPKLIALDWNSFKRIRVDCFFRIASLHLGYLPPLGDLKGTTALSQCIFSLRFNLVLFGWHVLAFWQTTRCSVEVATKFFTFSAPHFLLTQAHLNGKRVKKLTFLTNYSIPLLWIQFHHALLVVIKSSVVIL